MASTSSAVLQEQHHETAPQSAHEADELARTAGLLLENVKHEQNPKFQKSAFMGLMKQLRDGEIIVEGNKMVESDGRTSSQANAKGKARAIDNMPVPVTGMLNGMPPQSQQEAVNQDSQKVEEDPNDAYFRQENNDYMRYWNDPHLNRLEAHGSTAETRSWDRLQSDWEKFEATAAGIKEISTYQFQRNNPYLLGDSSRTRNHLIHSEARQSVLEVRSYLRKQLLFRLTGVSTIM